MANWFNWCYGQFYQSRIEVLQIAQFLALVIFCVNFSSERKSERIERKFKTQNPNLSSTWKKSGGSQKASSAEKKFTDFEFISEPFQCGVLKNIVENNDTGIFEELIKELEDVELSDKVRIFWEGRKTIKKFPTSDLTD